MIDCSIIIPVYNRASLTRQCLNGLLADPTQVRTEIIVIDDASSDLTPELLRSFGDRIRVITRAVNGGFADSCNRGAALASGTFLIFLNNDTLTLPGWLDKLYQYAMAHPQAAIVGAKLLYPDDTVQHAGVVISEDRYPHHLYAGFPPDHAAVNKSRRFQIVTAACALMRREVFLAFHGFDTRYLNGYEDVDLCLRMGAAGHEIHFCHTAALYHLETVTRHPEPLAQNLQLYAERWRDRVIPDEFRYYLDDGLIQVQYSPAYPIHLSISPLLATIQDATRVSELEHLLHLRAMQSSRQRREFVEIIAASGDMERVRGWERGRDNTLLLPNAAIEGSIQTETGAVSRRTELLPRAIRTPVDSFANVRLVNRGSIHTLQGRTSGRLYSILMPVKNGANLLSRSLPLVLRQLLEGQIEITAVDSGSEDETLQVLEQYDATILAIPPKEFNHGLTRNLLASYANGDVLIFLNQSAQPTDEFWLANLVAPLEQDSTLAGVCSRLVPRTDADVLVRRDVMQDPSSSNTSRESRITDWSAYRALDPDALRYFINFHSISAAIRPAVLERIPFPAVPLIGEDLSWAKQVLEAGYALRHEALSAVFHSHAYSYTELLQRNFDDALLNRTLVGREIGAEQVMPGILAAVREDWQYLGQKSELDAVERENLRVESVMRRTAQWVGQYLGGHTSELPADAIAHLALTEHLKTARSRPS